MLLLLDYHTKYTYMKTVEKSSGEKKKKDQQDHLQGKANNLILL